MSDEAASGRSAIVLFAHGSRDPQWAAPFRAMQRKLEQARPDVDVDLAFLELMQPSLPDAVERLVGAGCKRVTVAPLFMAQGAHLKRDLAALIEELRARHPHVEIVALPAAGESPAVIDAISAWLAAQC
jgi:sirohydrochlorin cobaltochelatase